MSTVKSAIRIRSDSDLTRSDRITANGEGTPKLGYFPIDDHSGGADSSALFNR
jgi:hypothetical protein